VLAEDIDASHVALWASIGNVVMGVFHTLSDGNAGQLVPGKVGAASLADGSLTAAPERAVASDVTGATTHARLTIANATQTNATRLGIRLRPR
jgi:hypothetical protein